MFLPKRLAFYKPHAVMSLKTVFLIDVRRFFCLVKVKGKAIPVTGRGGP
jgi:hypothetical protein